MSKRIILLLDGTWNDADRGDVDTNIVRLRERIAMFLRSAKSYETSPGAASQQTVVMRGKRDGDLDNVVFYQRGVGTGGFLDNLKGGAFGAGLSVNIQRAYTFLVQEYKQGDEIYIFGFSRGSYTARSLVGCLNAVGLLNYGTCDAAALSQMWAHYRTHPAERIPTITEKLEKISAKVRIKCLGVFDTVGALGIPIGAFWRENRDLFSFHDVGLSQICDNSLHAVAIDEHREAFEATLWRQQRFTVKDQRVEQVWFTGSHGDIGGGYVAEAKRAGGAYLDEIPLDWMIRKVQAIADNDFPVDAPNPLTDAHVAAPQHESRRGMYCAFPFVFRSIYNEPVPVAPPPLERNVCYDRHATAIGERLHISAVLRLGEPMEIDGMHATYAPRNLIAAIRAAEQRVPLSVIGWHGEVRHDSAELLQSGLSKALS